MNQKRDYYKPIISGNAFNDNYIEYESNEDRDKMLSIEDYFDRIEPYLNDLIEDQET